MLALWGGKGHVHEDDYMGAVFSHTEGVDTDRPARPCGHRRGRIRKPCVQILHHRSLAVQLQVKPDTLVLNPGYCSAKRSR